MRSLLTRRFQTWSACLLATLVALFGLSRLHADELVATLPGSVSVDNKGAANYNIPLQMPPGRAGLEPKLSLNYSSQAGNGQLGVGWSLSTGFPQAITRGRSILARDGVVRGVTFTADDKFYLDGKRLICVSGSYGQPGSTYRTEVDSFVSITTAGSNGNIETFVLTDKSGSKMTFGKAGAEADGYQVGYYNIGSSADTLAYAYALKRVEDATGNYLTLSYANPAGGEYQLSRIDYTGGSGISAQAYVEFAYEARPDHPRTYVAGRSFEHSQRLATITARSNKSTGFAITATYALSYSNSDSLGTTTGRSRLWSITPSFADPATGTLHSVRATTVRWSNTTRAYTGQGSQFAMPSNLPLGVGFDDIIWGDFNGDGKLDYAYHSSLESSNLGIYVCLSNGSSFNAPTLWISNDAIGVNISRLFKGDIDGDGKEDLIGVLGLEKLYGLRSTGAAFSSLGEIAAIGPQFADPPSAPGGQFAAREDKGAWSRIVVADFTGDGRDDIVIPAYDAYLYLWESTGSSYIAKGRVSGATGWDVGSVDVTWIRSPEPNMGLGGFMPVRTSYPGPNVTVMPMDVNGDGRMDYVAMYTRRNNGSNADTYFMERRLQIMISKPDGTFSAPYHAWHPPTLQASTTPFSLTRDSVALGVLPGDYNGDGMMDFLCLTYNGGAPSWDLALSNGKGYGADEQPFDIYSYVLPTSLQIEGETVLTYCNVVTNASFNNTMSDAYQIARDPGRQAIHILDSGKLFNTFAFDVNGDGLTDLVWYVDKTATEAAATTSKGWYAMLSSGRISYGYGTSGNFTAPVKLPDSLFGAPPETGSYGAVFLHTEISLNGDLDGDGHPDLFKRPCNTGRTTGFGSASLACNSDLTKPAAFDDVVDRVTDGLGRVTEIAYRATKDDALYTPGAAVSYPIRELRANTPVVADVYHDSGGATQAHFNYQYSGRRLDLSGRGDLGFHSFVTLDQQTNLFKYQFLTQSFPMTGLTAREETYRYLGGGKFRFISSHDNTVVFDEVVTSPTDSTSWGTVWPYISKAVEYRWEDSNTEHFTLTASGPSAQAEGLFAKRKPSGEHIKISAESQFDQETAAHTTLPTDFAPSDTITPASGSDPLANKVTGLTSYTIPSLGLPRKISYGNLWKLTTDYGSGYTETVTTTYKPANGALTGLVDTVSTTATGGGYTDSGPIRRFTYWSNGATPTPLVWTEEIDATDNALDLKTTYTRDSRGRVTNTQITNTTATGLQVIGDYSVASVTAFDDKFDLPSTAKNAAPYLHPTTTLYDQTLGLPTSVKDANNAEITTQYDALGRPKQVRDVLKNLQTDTNYSWDNTVTVSPPSGVTGLTLTSVYKVEVTTTAQPKVTSYYDRLGRVIRSVKESYGTQTATVDTIYNVLGQVVAVSNPYASSATDWTKTTYDALGRVKDVAAPNGTVTTSTYNGRATIVTVDAPNLGGADPAAQTNATLVDAKGRTVKVWNANNVPTFSDTLGSTTATASIEFKLDGFGRMRETILKDQTQKIIATYDALGRQTIFNDPDKGNWSYLNNALGQVVSQTDGRSTVTTSSFDRLGRPLTRTTTESGAGAPVETAKWFYYDSTPDAATQRVDKGAKGWIGALAREEHTLANALGYTDPGSTKYVYYDTTKGLPEIALSQIDGKWFYTHTTYDTYARPGTVRYYWRPSGHEAAGDYPYLWETVGFIYTYDGKGFVTQIADTSDAARVWWKANAGDGYDHLGRPVRVQKGNAHWTVRSYRASDGVLESIKTGPSIGSTSIQNQTFGFDGLGNLRSRTGSGGTETLDYDLLNRLISSKQGAISYFDNGNIRNKPNVAGTNSTADYTYDSTRPHAVASAFGYTMTYDGNGNLLTRTGGGETWSLKWAGFDKPRWMAKVGTTTAGNEFLYDGNRSRVLNLEFDAVTGSGTSAVPSHYTRKKLYAAGAAMEVDYENTAATGAPAWKQKTVRVYVSGPDGTAGALELPPADIGGTTNAYVYHADHLGSIESITRYGDATVTLAVDRGNKTGRFSEDAWGQRRDPLTWSGAPSTTDDGGTDSLTPRGFTGHEMLDGIGLVHMNGRIYDPLLGRFLSADVLVDGAGDLQGFNRYSYVKNNPLVYVDPTGFSLATSIPKVAYHALRDRMARAGAKGLVQIHHIVGQQFLKNPDTAKFLGKVGFNIDKMDNLIALPTRLGKEVLETSAGRSLHAGRHVDSYVKDVVGQKLEALRSAFDAKEISADAVRDAIKGMQQEIRAGLKDGSIQLGKDNLEKIEKGEIVAVLGVAIASQSTAEGAETRQKIMSEAQETNEEFAELVSPLKAETYFGGTVGKIVDMFNPIEDVQAVFEMVNNMNASEVADIEASNMSPEEKRKAQEERLRRLETLSQVM